MALGLGHAGRRLVEQEDARPAGEGERDFEQALLAVGQHRGALGHDVGEAEALQQFADLLGDAVPGADDAPPVAARSVALGNREPQRFDRGEVGEQLVDLEGARDAELHPLVGREPGDGRAVEQDLPARRPQHAGEQVDEGGLAGAVRSDQGVAGAFLDRERDRIGGDDAAEPLVEASRFQDRRHGQPPFSGPAALVGAGRRPSCEANLTTGEIQLPMRSRPITTMATSSSPIQNCQ